MKTKMIALGTFKGVEGFIIRGNKFETTERRAKVLKRKKLAQQVIPAENKMINPDEKKDSNGGDEESNLLNEENYKVSDLEEVAKLLNMSGYSSLNKENLLKEISDELLKRNISDLNTIGKKEELINLIKDKELN